MSTLARKLRKTPTPAEVRLWRQLFDLRTGGFHFRKQAPIGHYIVDIACHHAKLVIEVDGDTHGTDSAIARDIARDTFLRREGYTVLRFSNDEVMQNMEGVYLTILDALQVTP